MPRPTCDQHCARVGPHKTCIVELSAAMAADTRRDTPIVLARGVIRTCREQDGSFHIITGKAAAEISRWRAESASAGDRAVVDAIDLLGVDEAVRVYKAPNGRAMQLDASEKARLAKAAEKARTRC
jgi:hypothetical protein